MTIQELEICIQKYGTDIYSFCIHLTNNKELADDLYQDTFLETMKKLSSINIKENPKSFILSIAVRIWKNRVRKYAWRNRIAPSSSDENLEEITACEGSPIENVINQEEKQALWRAIDNLSDSLKLPLLLYYMEELSIADIAKTLSIPQGTVKSRLYKARKCIEEELEEFLK